MYQLKGFTVTENKKEPHQFFATVSCKVGDIEVGYITRNLATLKSDKKQYALFWNFKVDEQIKVTGDSVQELQDYALNKFREFICNVLE